MSTLLNYYYGIVALCTKSGPTQLHNVSDDSDSMTTRQLDTLDCKTSRRRNGVDATHAYWTVLVGISYRPTPSKITMIDGVTMHQWICQILFVTTGEVKSPTKRRGFGKLDHNDP